MVGGGDPSHVLVFLRVASLCGVTSLFSLGFGVPGESFPGAPFCVAL